MRIQDLITVNEAKIMKENENMFGSMDIDTVEELLRNHYKELDIKELIELLKVSYLHNIEMQLAQPQSAKEEIWYT